MNLKATTTKTIQKCSSYFGTCWLTTVVSSIAIFFLIMVTISSVNNYESVRVPRCVHQQTNITKLDNNTIHLVREFAEWDENQISILEQIHRNFPEFKLHLVILQKNGTQLNKSVINDLDILSSKFVQTTVPTFEKEEITKNLTMNSIFKKISVVNRRKRKSEEFGYGLNEGVKRLLDVILRSRANFINSSGILESKLSRKSITPRSKARTMDDIFNRIPNLLVENVTQEQAFNKTPLEKSWTRLNVQLQIFAIRIIQLWQYGGISFSLDSPMSRNNAENTDASSAATSSKLLRFITRGKESFDKLPYGVVTADDEGLHIFSKMPCHAFFGEIILQLKHANLLESVKGVLKKSLHIFCKHAAVNKSYCDNLSPNNVIKI
ncbi:uncharacterized protein LOC132699114 isoform X2 [Cylas formicarius]|uniref:uncharacterized protein LOC132699114 isoform X2 n=1 Tax=Cylas formicarius TaxID=197179 RepID=UPI002958D3D0|nr:uncharacterized protein LOC132699114 isoform X2 [Cylas formicarius]